MKFDNYMILDFPSRSTNEAFARSAVASRPRWTRRWRSWGISAPPSLRR